MNSIKIFLASSEELEDDRNAFGNLVRRLDNIYEPRGIRIELFEWEDYGAAYNNRRKQDEYNDKIKASDMFLALFHTKAGKFTIEEFDVATEEFRKHASPKVYVYCKDLQPYERATPELIEFKRKLFEEFGHYWSRYQNRDSMQLHFVMQLQLIENSGSVERLKVEDGMVVLDDMPIAKLDNLQYAAGNAAYQKMSAELAELPIEIVKSRKRADKYPDDEDLQNDLQQKLNRYNSLKEDFAQLQQALFDTAQRITIMQQERVNDMLRRAIDAFEEGNVERANTLLDEMAIEAEHHIEQLDKQRELVHQDIEAFLLQAKTVMADARLPIDNRIEKASSIYAKADEWAMKSVLPDEKYEKLLSDYSSFLLKYAKNENALDVYCRLRPLRETMYGTDHIKTVAVYNDLGLLYNHLGDYESSFEEYYKALNIMIEKKIGVGQPNVISLLNNIGVGLCNIGEYKQALGLLTQAITICEEHLPSEHPVVIATYNNIGQIYMQLGIFDKSMEYYSKALSANKRIIGMDHPNTATSFNNIGEVYYRQGDYVNALKSFKTAFDILKSVLGKNHPNTIKSFSNIAKTFNRVGRHEEAIKFFSRILSTQVELYGLEHTDVANTYREISDVYFSMGKKEEALDYCLKALNIFEKQYGDEHPIIPKTLNMLGSIYLDLKEYNKALDPLLKALHINEELLGSNSLLTATLSNNIGSVLFLQGHYDKALVYYLKALPIREELLGEGHPITINTYKSISYAYKEIGEIARAKEYEHRALQKMEKDEHVSSSS